MGTTEQVNYIREVIYMQCKSKNVLVFKSRKIILTKIRLYSLIIWPCNQNLCEKEKKKVIGALLPLVGVLNLFLMSLYRERVA